MKKKKTPEKNQQGIAKRGEVSKFWIVKECRSLGTLATILFVTFLTLRPVLDNGLLNYDDDVYVVNNTQVKEPELKKVFRSSTYGVYCPIPMLTYAYDYQTYGLPEKSDINKQGIQFIHPSGESADKYEGYGYHRTNLIIHLLSVCLVFFFIQGLSGSLFAAGFTAFMFGIHPMNVESVAWVSERKNLCYTIFYLAALLAFVKFHGRTRWIVTGIFFTLSLLSKGPAVTLPVVLVALSVLIGGKYCIAKPWEKLTTVAFFMASLCIGIVAIKSQGDSLSTNVASVSVFEHGVLVFYKMLLYVQKLGIPTGLTIFRPYPEKTNGWYPFVVYASPVLVIAFFGFLFWKFKSDKIILFWVVFFLANLVLLLVPVEDSLISDRYAYMASIGFFAGIGTLIARYTYNPRWRSGIVMACAACALFHASLAHERSQVWHNTRTIFEDAESKFPGSSFIEGSLGSIYQEKHDWQNATQYLYKALENKNPWEEKRFTCNHASLFIDLSYVHFINQEWDSVIVSTTQALRYVQNGQYTADYVANIFQERGLAYAHLRRFDQSVDDLQQCVRLDSASIHTWSYYNNLANVYHETRNLDTAILMLEKAMQCMGAPQLVYTEHDAYINERNNRLSEVASR